MADSSSPEAALEIVTRYGITLPSPVLDVLQTPRPAVTAADIRSEVRIIATPSGALEAAAEQARTLGYTPLILGDALEGKARSWGDDGGDCPFSEVSRLSARPRRCC